MMASREYDYEFSLWPNEHGWEQPVYQIFQMYPRLSDDVRNRVPRFPGRVGEEWVYPAGSEPSPPL